MRELSLDNQEPFVAGGYFLARTVPRPSYLTKNLLPDRIFSASHCIGKLVPDNWSALNWDQLKEKQRREFAPEIGVEQTRIPELVKWVTERWDSQLGWGNVFYSADVARSFVDGFGVSTHDLVLFSIALHEKHIGLFVKETRSPERIIPSGIWIMVQKGLPPEAGGKTIGYDVLGYDLAWAHSWLCYSFERDASERLGIRPNSHGFVETFEDAEKIAEYADSSDAPIENKPWLPWLVTVHPITKVAL